MVKLLEGTQGIGVVLCETQKAAESVIEAFIQTNNNILVQEYIREANGADIRCLVVNGRWWPPCAARPSRGVSLQPAPGGTAEAIKITPEERATAVQAAKIMGLDVAGVDILRSARGPLVLEVNSSPVCRGGSRLRQGRGGQDHRVPRAQGEPQAQAGGMSPKRVSDR